MESPPWSTTPTRTPTATPTPTQHINVVHSSPTLTHRYKAYLFSQEAREALRAASWYKALANRDAIDRPVDGQKDGPTDGSTEGTTDMRFLYIDLDSVIVGPLDELATTKLTPSSPLGLLGTDDMVNEVSCG